MKTKETYAKTIEEIAEHLDISDRQVRRYKRDYRDFPEYVDGKGYPVQACIEWRVRNIESNESIEKQGDRIMSTNRYEKGYLNYLRHLVKHDKKGFEKELKKWPAPLEDILEVVGWVYLRTLILLSIESGKLDPDLVTGLKDLGWNGIEAEREDIMNEIRKYQDDVTEWLSVAKAKKEAKCFYGPFVDYGTGV